MNFKFLIISMVITAGFVGSAFAQQSAQLAQQEFSQEEIDEMKHKAVLIQMHDGTFMIELFPEDAPNTVNNFLKLVESGYYEGIVFHRIIPGFMIQGGDPNTKNSDKSTWGQGGPGYNLKAEFSSRSHLRGIVSMARANDPDSAGSQFFIVTSDSTFLDKQYTVFGEVIDGIEVADKIVNLPRDGNDCPEQEVKMLEVTISE